MAGIRPFTDFLRDQRGGELQDELAKELNRLVASVQQTGKKGKLVLTVTVAPIKEGITGQFIVADDVEVKIPKLSKGATLFFGTPENNLSRRDPRQSDLDLKPVTVAAVEPKAIEGVS